MNLERLKNIILTADPRLKALLALWLGIMTWRAGLPGIFCYLAVVLFLAHLLSACGEKVPLRFRILIIPVLFWMLLKGGLEFVNHQPLWPQIVQETALLGSRLLVLLLLGLILTWATSRTQLGAAVNWFLRPVLGARSWQGGLALSLMIHFIPLTLRTLSQVRQSIRLRCPDMFFGTRIFLWVRTVLRVLSRKTWDQTLAIAARNLDGPEAWQDRSEFRKKEWGAGLVLAGIVFGLALL
ncbi:MAG: ABC transporter [Thermodesulfobacteriota bacterium]